jgi:hypothetical protein
MQFIESAAFLMLLLGMVTTVVWLKSGHNLPLQTSYYRAVLFLARFVGLAIIVISSLCLLFALSDLIEITRFGSSVYSVPAGVLFIIVGYGVQRLAAAGLRSSQLSN